MSLHTPDRIGSVGARVGTNSLLQSQCWLFMIGSTLFGVGTAPGFAAFANATVTNVLCFVGSWFFTLGATVQFLLCKPPTHHLWTQRTKRAEWLSALVQLVGTVLFNISTGSALVATHVDAERGLVWAPNAEGSIAFLVSGALAVFAVSITAGVTELKSRDWQAAWLNMAGCLAFGVSAVAAFIRRDGVTEDAVLANFGTFVGAVCFLLAAYLTLPKRTHLAAAAA